MNLFILLTFKMGKVREYFLNKCKSACELLVSRRVQSLPFFYYRLQKICWEKRFSFSKMLKISCAAEPPKGDWENNKWHLKKVPLVVSGIKEICVHFPTMFNDLTMNTIVILYDMLHPKTKKLKNSGLLKRWSTVSNGSSDHS